MPLASSRASNFSDSIVKLQPGASGLSLADFFTPYSQAKMAQDDLDLGSAGVMLLPDQPGAFPHLAITSGKNGHIYVLNRDNLGGYYHRRSRAIRRSSRKSPANCGSRWERLPIGTGGCISEPASVRITTGSKLSTLHNGALSATPASQSAAIYHLTRSTVSVSANGNGNGIVWAVDNDAYYSARQGPAVLHAYDARNLAHELYNSNQRFCARQSRAGLEVYRADHRERQGLRRHRKSGQCLRLAASGRELASGRPLEIACAQINVPDRTQAARSGMMR